MKIIDNSNGDLDLNNYKDKWLVIYFYPKDNTPGCTIEACSFRDNLDEFIKRNMEVIGVSPDRIESHQKFIKKFNLNFTLVADTNKLLAQKFGAIKEKKYFNKKIQSISRNTYLISPEGKIIKVYENVNPIKHAEKIIKDFDEIVKK